MREQRIQAERRMDQAKRNFTIAAKAALSGDPEAPLLAQAAFEELNRARAELDEISKTSCDSR